MIIISDTSPLSALAEIGELELLRRLYGKVVIPDAVRREATHPHAPTRLSNWLSAAESWLVAVPDPVALLPEVAALDAGEAAAISLAWNHRAEALVIIDEKAGRKLCDALGLAKTGTAGILLAGARAKFVDFESAIQRLQATSFRIHPKVLTELRERLRQTAR